MITHFQQTWRLLRRNPLYAVLNTIGLATGLTAGGLVLLFILNETSFDRFHKNRKQLFRVEFVQQSAQGTDRWASITAAVGPSLSAILPVIEGFTRLTGGYDGFFSNNDNLIQTKNVIYADSSFFDLFTFRLISGNPAHVLKHPRSIVLTAELAEAMNLDSTQRGALVIDVNSGTPAESAGLQGSDRTASINGQDARVGGDVITAVDSTVIDDFEDLTAYLARYTNVGQTIEVTYVRDGQENSTSLTLAVRPGTETGTSTTTEAAASNAWLGITGMDMSDEIASAMDLTKTPEGVLIEQITAGSPADEAGLRGSYKPLEVNGEEILVGGDIITAVDNTSISGINQLASTIATYQAGDEISLTILRSGKEMRVSVTLAEKP